MADDAGQDRVVRVLPDVAAIDRCFDYSVPAPLEPHVRVGTMVRIALGGRRLGGWVVADDVEAPPGVRLRPLAKVTGWGPPAELVDLTSWAAWRWAGRRSALLRAASPLHAVRGLPPSASPPPGPAAPSAADEGAVLATEALAGGVAVVRLAPAADAFAVVEAAVALGQALVLAPSVAVATHVARRLRRSGRPVALVPGEWARAAAGGCTVVGARSAAWAPAPGLAAVVVLDAHDEVYSEERAPTWWAIAVAAERARRAGAPCALVSPCPTVELLALGRLVSPSRATERAGWAALDLVDRRRDDPRTGLYSPRLVAALRAPGRVVCVLNRKGRARLLVCATCAAVIRCERCGAGEAEGHDRSVLRCPRCGLERPRVCQACGSSQLKSLRLGVTRVREELEVLGGRPVAEVTGEAGAGPAPDAPVLVGTEAVLHRVERADVVCFLDVDAELLAPRYAAAEETLGLLARAARLVGGRASGGRVMAQTRDPHHPALQAALHGDPGRLAEAEAPVRRALRLPPAAAVALVSGDRAAEFAAEVAGADGVDVSGPDGERWLVRAPHHAALADALAAVPRPAGRLRVEVDPRRV